MKDQTVKNTPSCNSTTASNGKITGFTDEAYLVIDEYHISKNIAKKCKSLYLRGNIYM